MESSLLLLHVISHMSSQLSSSSCVHPLPFNFTAVVLAQPASFLTRRVATTNSERILTICQSKHPKTGTKSFSFEHLCCCLTMHNIEKSSSRACLLMLSNLSPTSHFSYSLGFTKLDSGVLLGPPVHPLPLFSVVEILLIFKVNSKPVSSVNPCSVGPTSFVPRLTGILILTLLFTFGVLWPPGGYIFICGYDRQPWVYECLNSWRP